MSLSRSIDRRVLVPLLIPCIVVALGVVAFAASLMLAGCSMHEYPAPIAQVEPPPIKPPAPTVQVNIRATERSVVVLGNMGDAVKLGDEHNIMPKPDPPAGKGEKPTSGAPSPDPEVSRSP